MYHNIYREMAVRNRMTITDLSKEVGICAKSMSNKLSRKTAFNIDEMFKIQRVFGGCMTLDELFEWVDG